MRDTRERQPRAITAASFSETIAAVIPLIRTTLFLDCAPARMVTRERARPNIFAISSISASLARPSVGGLLKETLSPLSCTPTFCLLRSRMHADTERDPSVRFAEIDHSRAPKIAVPMRTHVEPSSIAT